MSDLSKQKLFCSDEMRSRYELECATTYQKTNSLEFETIARGIVHPLQLSETMRFEDNQFGGVTDSDLKFVDLSLTRRISPPNIPGEFPNWFKGANPNVNYSDIDYLDEEVVFLGALSKHYGHFILEGLARLWFYLDEINLKYRCVYISEDGEDRYNECFKLFGIEDHNISRITAPTRFRSVIVPEPSIRLHDYYHEKFKATIDGIKQAVEPAKYEKVYFSKAGIKNNRAIGEASIEAVFRENSFSVLAPEKLSMYETISVLKGCEVFAATSATNIHNAIFMNDGKRTICLNRSAHFHPIQTMIDEMRGLDNIYVDVFIVSSDANFGNAPCLLAPTRHLVDFFENYQLIYDKWWLYKKFPGHFLNYLTIRSRRWMFNVLFGTYNRMKSSKWKSISLPTEFLRQICRRG